MNQNHSSRITLSPVHLPHQESVVTNYSWPVAAQQWRVCILPWPATSDSPVAVSIWELHSRVKLGRIWENGFCSRNIKCAELWNVCKISRLHGLSFRGERLFKFSQFIGLILAVVGFIWLSSLLSSSWLFRCFGCLTWLANEIFYEWPLW